MPSFTFDILVTLTRGTEQILIARHTHSLYYTIYMALVEQMTREFTKEGWRIKKVELENFEFVTRSRIDLY